MRKKTGFTLVEILIGIASAGIIGAILVSFLTQNSRIYSFQNSKVTQGIELNNASAEIDQTIKSAVSVVSQYPTSGQATHTTGLNTLIVSIASINAQGNVIADTYDHVVFHKDSQNNKIMRKRLYPNVSSNRAAENEVLSTKLSKLEFRYLDASDQTISPVQAAKVGFIINVADNIATETQSSSASGVINLRNN